MNVGTIAGECGSGSVELGHLVVLTLGWKLQDGQVVGAWHASPDWNPKPQLVGRQPEYTEVSALLTRMDSPSVKYICHNADKICSPRAEKEATSCHLPT
jgi:hypothetical protein